jgi:hypothetical protein
MAPTAPILDLGVLAKRPTLRVDGKTYEMRTSNEYTYLVYSQFQRKFERLGQLLKKKKKKSQADWKEQARLQDEFVRSIVIAPESLYVQLGDFERLEIIKAFFTQVRTTTSRSAVAPKPGRLSAASPSGRK